MSLPANALAKEMQVKIWKKRDFYLTRRIGGSRRLKAGELLATVRSMPRTFSIEVAKDYFNFASAHFLIFANGQREPLHGHNYQVSVKLEGELDSAGVVLDFITFKPLVKRVCDALDHRTLIQAESPLLKVRRRAREVEVFHRKQRLLLPRSDVILLPLMNTSTELLAEHIADKIRREVRRRFPRTQIRYIEVGVEEARGQRGLFRGEF
jgi:6-pyruvoyltetrahydropterin/6-carboxytetrahydropterin synthase